MPYKIVKTIDRPCVKCKKFLRFQFVTAKIIAGYCADCNILTVSSYQEAERKWIDEARSVYWKE